MPIHSPLPQRKYWEPCLPNLGGAPAFLLEKKLHLLRGGPPSSPLERDVLGEGQLEGLRQSITERCMEHMHVRVPSPGNLGASGLERNHMLLSLLEAPFPLYSLTTLNALDRPCSGKLSRVRPG